jgi:lipid-A-disaccharide synthase
MGDATFQELGMEVVVDPTATTVLGLVEVLRHLGEFRRQLQQCLNHILETRPERVVLIDYPGFHMRLADRLKRLAPEIQIVQYISPKFWAWNYRRVHKMRRVLDHVLCIFPFEPSMLREAGIQATFVGNPLLDQMDLQETGGQLRSDLGIKPTDSILGLLPGSRKGEIRRILPTLLDAASLLERRGAQFIPIIASAPGIGRQELEALSQCLLNHVQVVQGRSHELMASSRVLLAKSGTTTLEAALLGTPMVVPYRTSWLTAFLANRVLRTKHFSLPNILACDFPEDDGAHPTLVPELLQGDATPQRIVEEALPLWSDGEKYSHTREGLLALREVLGGPGASERAAGFLLGGAPEAV